jgi:hypothetical protein
MVVTDQVKEWRSVPQKSAMQEGTTVPSGSAWPLYASSRPRLRLLGQHGSHRHRSTVVAASQSYRSVGARIMSNTASGSTHTD